MITNYQLEKWVWTDADYEQMGWHDCRIRAFAFLGDELQLMLDIDYIFEWVQLPDSVYFQFWVAPATLIFENVYDIEIDIHTDDELEIADLLREDPLRPRNADYVQREQEWKWIFDCQRGEISLRSIGYAQYIRSAPRLVARQYLTLNERGGISFSRGRAAEEPPCTSTATT